MGRHRAAHLWIASFATEGGQKSFDAHLSAARDAIARALSIEPDLPNALLARATIETNFDFNWNAATQTVTKALALAPADPNIVIAAGNLEKHAETRIVHSNSIGKQSTWTRSMPKPGRFSPLIWRQRSDLQKRRRNTRGWLS